MPSAALAFAILPLDLEDPVVALLARHIALDIYPQAKLQECMALDRLPSSACSTTLRSSAW